MPSVTSQQARYWMLTIPHHHFTPYLPNGVSYLKGQLEQGEQTHFLHWQLMVVFPRKLRLGGVTKIFGTHEHCEPTRSEAASDYVWKEETRIAGTSFELGRIPFNRGNSADWDQVRQLAQAGRFDEIPSDIFIRCHAALKNIAKDHLAPIALERKISVYWGGTGLGKSRLAWEQATFDAYPKDPMTKFWDGYRNQKNVVMDEFYGDISINHVLRWFDRYPVNIEAKHGATTLSATRIWVTSNNDPRSWYPHATEAQREALMRRLDITHFQQPLCFQ